MGGVPPLGYDVANRRLVPTPREAKLVRHSFQRFVELGSSTTLVKELKLDGMDHLGRQDARGQVHRQGVDLQTAR